MGTAVMLQQIDAQQCGEGYADAGNTAERDFFPEAYGGHQHGQHQRAPLHQRIQLRGRKMPGRHGGKEGMEENAEGHDDHVKAQLPEDCFSPAAVTLRR